MTRNPRRTHPACPIRQRTFATGLFFWRLRSFEDHVFRGNEFAASGMRSDVQAMAVVVEHTMRALSRSTEVDLYGIFKELWNDPEVTALLKSNKISHAALQPRQVVDKVYRQRIEALRKGNAAERIVADLVLATRIRRAVHEELSESDPWALEDLFGTLMRAAVRTFAHRRTAMLAGSDATTST